MRLIIVTGMSGAGKSTALNVLEDAGYFCVDNLPIKLLSKFAQLCMEAGEGEERGFCVGVDIRDEKAFNRLPGALEDIEALGLEYEIFFLDASDDVLLKRFKETRRAHPLSRKGRIEEGILEERKKMEYLRSKADHIIDTSRLLVRDLKQEICRIYVEQKEYSDLYITILSFGFKYGIPQDSDLVFDVRFAPNPYYIEELRIKTGLDREIRDYLRKFPEVTEFEDRLADMIRFLIPHYIKEGKNQLVISLGCTGGRHRSVMMAQALYERLSGGSGYGIRVEHRDLSADLIRKG